MRINKKKAAFTIVETVLAVTILMFLFSMVWQVYAQFLKTYRYFVVRNEIYDETHFLFEEMIKKVRNWNVDYQSYWRENTRIGVWGGNRIVDAWWEWPNPQWSNASISWVGNFNSVRNCDDDSRDYNLTWTWRAILENYLYQFIFPWIPHQDLWSNNYLYNFFTSSVVDQVHLNCKDDSTPEDVFTVWNQMNVYDDDESYWRGPKAFSWASSDWLWSWSWSLAWTANNNPPLLLVSWNWNKRVAFRHWTWTYADMCDNWTWCMLMLELEATNFDKNWIPDSWSCLSDYTCPSTFTWLMTTDIWWKDITPSKIIVTDFDFYIWPEKYSHYVFNETWSFLPSYFTIKLRTRSAPWVLVWTDSKSQTGIVLDLQTTIIPRNNNPIKTLN